MLESYQKLFDHKVKGRDGTGDLEEIHFEDLLTDMDYWITIRVKVVSILDEMFI